MDDNEKSSFLAGFDLAGQRKSDGKLYAYISKSVIDEWPNELELMGNTYTLENIIRGENGYESAQYA